MKHMHTESAPLISEKEQEKSDSRRTWWIGVVGVVVLVGAMVAVAYHSVQEGKVPMGSAEVSVSDAAGRVVGDHVDKSEAEREVGQSEMLAERAKGLNMDKSELAVALKKSSTPKGKPSPVEVSEDLFNAHNGASNPMVTLTTQTWAVSPTSCAGANVYHISAHSRINRIVSYFHGNGNLAGLYVFHANGASQPLGSRTPSTGYSVSHTNAGVQGISGVSYNTQGSYVTGFNLMWDDDKLGEMAQHAIPYGGRNFASYWSQSYYATRAFICADGNGVKFMGLYFS